AEGRRGTGEGVGGGRQFAGCPSTRGRPSRNAARALYARLGSRRSRRSTGGRRDWLRATPDSRRHAYPRVLRAVRVRAPTQACPRRCRIGRGGGGRRGVELLHRVSDAASIGEGQFRTAYVDPRGLGWRRFRNVAVGEAGRCRDVRNVLGASGRSGPGTG